MGLTKNDVRRDDLRRMSASLASLVSALEQERDEFEALGDDRALEWAESADLAVGQLNDALQALEWAQELISEIGPVRRRRVR